MSRQTVRVVVLSALGLASCAHAGPVIPEVEQKSPTTIPELSEGEKSALIPEINTPQTSSLKELFEARWADGLGGVLPRLDDAVPSRREEVESMHRRLADAPRLVGPSVNARQITWGRKLDLTKEQDRVDSVLICFAFGLSSAECDLHGLLSKEQAQSLSGGTPSVGTSPFLDEHLRWRRLVDHCEQPKELDRCGGGYVVDGKTGQCYKHMLCRRGRLFAGGRRAELTGEARTEAGAAWAQIALEEHASVASFAQHALELMAVGAPLPLLAAVSRAQLDEVRHTELALSLAKHFGAEVEIGALNTEVQPKKQLFEVLKALVEEGCIGETLAAVECAVALEQTEDPMVRAVLEEIVADESAHAALAFRTLAWGLPLLSEEEKRQVLKAFGEVVVRPAPKVMEGIGVIGGEAAAAARRWGMREVVFPALAKVV